MRPGKASSSWAGRRLSGPGGAARIVTKCPSLLSWKTVRLTQRCRNGTKFPSPGSNLGSSRRGGGLPSLNGVESITIFDTSDGKGYVGSAYGDSNLLGRWLEYAASGHGGNRLLQQRDPRQFRFTILQRVSPDERDDDVIRLEGTWKQRLHTRPPYGLNE